MTVIINGSTGIDTVQDGIVTNAKIASMAATKLTGQIPDANAPSGSVIQVVSATKTDVFSSTSTSFVDITGLSVNITPTNTSNKIMVFASMTVGSTPNNIIMLFRLMRNSTTINIGDARTNYTQVTIGGARGVYDTNGANTLPILYLDSPTTTDSTTYKVQGMCESGTFRINATGADASSSNWSFTAASTITVMEIAG